MPLTASPPRDAHIHLHCADALTTTFSREDRCARARTVVEAGGRMPALGFFGTYGDRWYVDLVALPDNAVRRQMLDAYTMANALAKMSHDVAAPDLARVYGWLGTLDGFVCACFEAEERFLYPLVEQASRRLGAACPQGLEPRCRVQAKKDIRALLQAAMKTRDVTSSETRGRIKALRYALDQFGEAVLAYFSLKEGFIPKLFRTGLKNGEKEKGRLDRAFFDFLLDQPQGGMMAALVLQCIESRKGRAAFIQRNIKKSKERTLFNQHIRTVENRHMKLPSAFATVSGEYEQLFDVNTFMESAAENPDAARGFDSLCEDADLDLM